MGLSSLHWLRFVLSSQRCFIFTASILLVACSVVPAQPVGSLSLQASSAEEKLPEEQPALPLSAELVYDILTAEIAGQRGEIGIAADLYSNAANLVDSPTLAARAAQLANFTRSQPRINRALTRWIEVDPSDADIYIMQVPFLLLQRNYDTVIKNVDTALTLAPEQAEAYLAQVSKSLIEFSTPEQALNTIQQLKIYQANDPEAHFAYARVAAFYKQYDSALVDVDKVLKNQADRADALILKSEILQRMGNTEAAIALLKNLASKKDASEDIRFSYAKLLGENNKLEEARAAFLQLHTDFPENEDVVFALGVIALQDQDGKQAKHYFNQLIALGDSSQQAAYFMGLAEKLNNNDGAAMTWFSAVPENSHRFQAAQSNYVSLLAESGQMEKARQHLKLLRLKQPSKALEYYSFEAALLRERDQNQAAFDLYTEALKQFPEQTDLLYGRAMVAESLNNLRVLEDDLRTILKKEPNNSHALNALGYTLADRTDRLQEALVLIEKAIKLNPNDAFYLDSLAWVHYRLGNMELAEQFIKQAVAIQPDPELLAHLGEILWKRGKFAEAKIAWDDGLKQDRNNQLILKTMSRFGL